MLYELRGGLNPRPFSPAAAWKKRFLSLNIFAEGENMERKTKKVPLCRRRKRSGNRRPRNSCHVIMVVTRFIPTRSVWLWHQTSKKQIYARGGIPVYWTINLIEQQIESYAHPSDSAEFPDYQKRHDYHRNERIPVLIDAQRISELTVAELPP